MTYEEHKALQKAGVTLHKLSGGKFSTASLSLPMLLTSNWKQWPDLPDVHDSQYPGTNTLMIGYLGKQTGLSYDKDTGRLSVSLSHPMAAKYLAVLQPVWDLQNAAKCPTCHGSGWDGEGYVLSCADCGGTGRAK
jgi:hypothetical protein